MSGREVEILAVVHRAGESRLRVWARGTDHVVREIVVCWGRGPGEIAEDVPVETWAGTVRAEAEHARALAASPTAGLDGMLARRKARAGV